MEKLKTHPLMQMVANFLIENEVEGITLAKNYDTKGNEEIIVIYYKQNTIVYYNSCYDELYINHKHWDNDNLNIPEKYIANNYIHIDGKKYLTEDNIEEFIEILRVAFDIKWKPKDNEEYYCPMISPFRNNMFCKIVWHDIARDKDMLMHNMVCKTKEEAISLAEKMLEVAKGE